MPVPEKMPKLHVDWLSDPESVRNRRASQFWAACMADSGQRLFLFDVELGVLYEEFHPEPIAIRVTMAQVLRVARDGGVYESGGPTAAKPGRQWLTRQPYPWRSNPYVKYREWERPIRLCEVSPVEWPPSIPGYITYAWTLHIIGDAEIIAALGWLWKARPRRCVKHGRRLPRGCPVCKGWRAIVCDCPACKQIPAQGSVI